MRGKRFFCLMGLVGWSSLSVTAATIGRLDAARVEAIAAMLPEAPRGIGPTGAEREKWRKCVESPLAHSYIQSAEAQLKQPPVELPDEGYLEFSRNGNRSNYQRLLGQRSARLKCFVFAELMEWEGRFLPAIEADLERLFAEKSWTLPAHDPDLTCFRQERFHGDLMAATMAAELAQIDWWFQDRLSEATRRRLREECWRRVIQPYLEDVRSGKTRAGQWWIVGKNNWNAVCSDGLARSSLVLLEDRRMRAEVLAAVEQSIPYFLDGFTPDGYCSEGVSYWVYGFGHYVIMAEAVLEATGGKLDFFAASPKIEAICAYARDIQITEKLCPAFADCGVEAVPNEDVLAVIQRHLPQTLLRRIPPAGVFFSYDLMPLRMFTDETQFAKELSEKPRFPLRKLFADAGVYIGRALKGDAVEFGVAFKAGHNDEQHNHNDVGSFVVVSNAVPYVVDPGGEVYTRRTFSKRRYESQMLNSYGHSVPVVAKELQAAGRAAKGTFIRTEFTDEKDTLVCDLKAAYPNSAALEKLTRTFVFDRANRRVTVCDEVEFASPQSFETALVTCQRIRKIDDKLFAFENDQGGVKVTISSDGMTFNATVGEVVNENATNPKRLAIALEEPVRHAAVTITIEPLP